MQRSAELMRTRTIDLMQVHNLRDTKVHMKSIRESQDEGRIRYSGLTHYTAGAHEALAREMVAFKPDFIQINYAKAAELAGLSRSEFLAALDAYGVTPFQVDADDLVREALDG